MFEIERKNVNVGNEGEIGSRLRSHKLEEWIGNREDGEDSDVINHSNKGLEGEVRSILI